MKAVNSDQILLELKIQAFEALTDNDYSGFLILDSEGKILFANNWYYKFMNLTTDIIGQDADEIFGKSKLKNCLRTGERHSNVYDTRFKVPIITNRVPLFKEGKPIGAVAFFREAAAAEAEDIDLRRQKTQLGLKAKYHFEDIISSNPEMEKLKDVAKLYAISDAPILISGESGTGKELFAQSIHNHSLRRNMPFVALNCATLNANILESELFGYEDGAFTGAKKGGQVGLFQTAHSGTILLDEIGEMPLSFQTKLLRVIQEKEIRPVGSNRVVPINTRIIACTNRDIVDLVDKGEFRLDLFYRLNVFTLHTLPLREHREDMEILAKDYFVKHKLADNWKKYHNLYTSIFRKLETYSFPGNIREFQNILERLILVTENKIIYETPEDVLGIVMPLYTYDLNKKMTPSISTTINDEASRILAILKECNGNKKQAAKELDMGIATLYRKISKYNLIID